MAASGSSASASMSSAGAAGGDKISSAKLRQRRKRKWVLVAVALIAVTLTLGWWPLSLVLVVLFYVANEVLLADHVFYILVLIIIISWPVTPLFRCGPRMPCALSGRPRLLTPCCCR